MNKSARVAKLMRGKRIELGFSQEGVAKKIGMKQGQFISNIERNLCALPIKYMRKIGKVLEINPDNLASAMKEDFNEYIDEQLASQVKEFWGSWEEEKQIQSPKTKDRSKSDTAQFVRTLRATMDGENLRNFIR